MTDKLTLSSIALACTLLAASSAVALDRAGAQVAQAETDDEKRQPADKAPGGRDKSGGAGDKSGGAGDKSGGAEKGERSRPRGDGDGDAPGRPPRPARDKDEGAPSPNKAPAPAARDDDGPPLKKARPSQAAPDTPEPAPKAAPPVEKRPLPKPAPKEDAAPRQLPKEETAPRPAPKAEPRLAPKEGPEPAPKAAAPGAFKKPEKGVEPKQRAPDAKGIDPKGDAPKDAPKGDAGKQRPPPPELKAPEPAPKGPDAASPKKDGAFAPKDKDGKSAPRVPGEKAVAAPPQVKDLKELKAVRKERSEDGGKRIVIEEPDKRSIVKEGGRTIIRHDETERFRRLGGDSTRREKRNGLDVSITVRPGGIEIYTETDDRGRPLRRYRRDRDGREVILYDNRDYYRRHRDGSFIEAIIDLPPPRLSIPRERYIVDYEDASDEDVYEALSSPPVEEIDRTYSLEEVRRSPMLRDRMRRVDLDTINFEFGAFEVSADQYPALARVAKAMQRVIDRNPDEMFLIEGHTDAVGSDEDNLSLSDRRAESVAIILTEEFQVPPENLTTQGYGEQYLKVDTEAAERQNRRVAVRRITPLLSRGKAQ